ncbi:helix-turn-helix domain-containing protein [Candidatus Magnetaquicoccus inordinatus]|uniref:helix-turn-helix domain-containing protein n=1 Tax=Candidatus Magnetaquicoccus inordinatus TaxID=2496818 RepID=UPI00102CCB7C|nr:helix-turn-helix domain-containing protein [Candidatus Magnetaquicoccus inordinatus]
MSRKAKQLDCDLESLQQLEALVRSKKSEFRLVERARMVMACLKGAAIREVAERFQTTTNTVIFWRDRFAQSGVEGLTDMPRSGRPARYDTEFRETVLRLLDMPPPNGRTRWSGVAIANALQVSDDAVSRLLRREGIRLRSGYSLESSVEAVQSL